MLIETDTLHRMIGLLGDEDSDVRQLAVESIADLMHTGMTARSCILAVPDR